MRNYMYFYILAALILVASIISIVSTPTQTTYDLLDPHTASMDIDAFQEQQDQRSVAFKPLKDEITEILEKTNATYSVYFEDLETGAWIGINHEARYEPKSLFKVPTASALLKKMEQEGLRLRSIHALSQHELDDRWGELYLRGENAELTYDELLAQSMVYSDNSAIYAIRSIVGNEAIHETRLQMGIPQSQLEVIPRTVSPRSFGNVFRSLYYSSYLKRPFSQYLLELLTRSPYSNYLQAGIPEDIRVAHKIGVDVDLLLYHDCGIVYTKDPYILCIMSQGSTQQEAEQIMRELSAATYAHVER